MCIAPHEPCVNYSLLRKQLRLARHLTLLGGSGGNRRCPDDKPAVCLSFRPASLLLRGVGRTRAVRNTHYYSLSGNKLKMAQDRISQTNAVFS